MNESKKITAFELSDKVVFKDSSFYLLEVATLNYPENLAKVKLLAQTKDGAGTVGHSYNSSISNLRLATKEEIFNFSEI